MKKLVIALIAAALTQGGAFAYWGLGLKLGGVTSSDTDFKNEVDYQSSVLPNYTGERTTANGFMGAELFFEGNSANRLGLALGLNSTGETKLEESSPGSAATLKASAQSIPVTLYWKHKGADSSLAFRLGGGAD